MSIITVLVDTDTITTWGQVATSLAAIAGVVWAIVRFAVLRPLDKRIKEATRQIQPDANGGKSLADVNKKVDTLADRLYAIEQRQLSIYEAITKPAPRRRSTKKETDE